MFTGIIEEVGTIIHLSKGTKAMELVIEGSKVCENLTLGESIAVNGICITVTGFKGTIFKGHVMAETLKVTTLGKAKVGMKVNLERALRVNGRLNGHIVAGHVDGLGQIIGKEQIGTSILWHIRTTPEIMRYIVYKGSVTINGISLTVCTLKEDQFSVSIIPHTMKETTLCYCQVGDQINIETDYLGRYVEKFLGLAAPEKAFKGKEKISSQKKCSNKKDINLEFLGTCGFL